MVMMMAMHQWGRFPVQACLGLLLLSPLLVLLLVQRVVPLLLLLSPALPLLPQAQPQVQHWQVPGP